MTNREINAINMLHTFVNAHPDASLDIQLRGVEAATATLKAGLRFDGAAQLPDGTWMWPVTLEWPTAYLADTVTLSAAGCRPESVEYHETTNVITLTLVDSKARCLIWT